MESPGHKHLRLLQSYVLLGQLKKLIKKTPTGLEDYLNSIGLTSKQMIDYLEKLQKKVKKDVKKI